MMTRNTLQPSSPQKAAIGLRERKKLEKEHAIRNAARTLFTAKGYDATTLREVAELADVGFGTVFAYANDKAGLLAMLFVDDLKSLPPSFGRAIGKRPILDQLTESFEALYEFWAKSPELSRIVLPQMEFYQPNPFAETILQRRQEIKSDLTKWLAQARLAGRIRRDVEPAQAAQMIFAIYTSSLREWILVEPLKIAAGVRRLRYLLELPLQAVVTPV
jgi:AcrR family transcriptional regulator